MDKMVVYEDDILLVVHKPAGIATETSKIGQADVVSELKNYRKSMNQDTYIGVVHRLDQPVEGLLVFAKTAHSARALCSSLKDGSLIKKYAALVVDVPDAQEGGLSDYLLKDGRSNLSKVVPPQTRGAKEAKLQWKRLKRYPEEGFSLVEVELFTGRHHQIRVQMSHAGMPLLGDMKYGTNCSRELSKQRGINCVALLAYKLSFVHPITGRKMEFMADYPETWKIAYEPF